MSTSKTILIADDEYSIVSYQKEIIENYQPGHEIIVSYDGADAFQKYKRYKPELLLVDVAMPIMSGLELIKSIFKIGEKPLIWAITGNCNRTKMIQLKELVNDKILLKPFKNNDIEYILDIL